MSAPTPTRRPSGQRDRLSVEHSSVYVSRRRLPLERLTRHLPRVSLPSPPGGAPALRARVRPFGVASAIAAGWAAGMGLIVVIVPVLLTWALAAHANSTARDAVVLGSDVWVGAHHVGFTVGGGRFALLPLGLMLVPVLLLRLSGGWAARILRPATLPDAALLAGATAVIYGLLGGLVAALAGRPDLHAAPWEAVLWCGGLAFVCVGWTTVRTCDLGGEVAALVPRSVAGVARPASRGLVAVLAGSAVVALLSLLVHAGDAIHVTGALDAGVVGTLVVALLSLLYLPNLVVWAAAFCVGPGFAVGTGTSVTLAGVASGPLPAFPLLAAVPSSGVPAAPVWLCLLVPIAGGVVTAYSTARGRPDRDPETSALWAGLAGVAAGLSLGVLSWLAGGSLGPGRLSSMGPSPWQVGALAAIELGVVAAVGAWVLGWRATRVRA